VYDNYLKKAVRSPVTDKLRSCFKNARHKRRIRDSDLAVPCKASRDLILRNSDWSQAVVQGHPQKFWFVESLGKTSENPGKYGAQRCLTLKARSSCSLWEKICGQKAHKNIPGKFGGRGNLQAMLIETISGKRCRFPSVSREFLDVILSLLHVVGWPIVRCPYRLADKQSNHSDVILQWNH